MKKIVIFIINLYQKTLSPDHGVPKVLFPNGYCRFEPSCSEYTKQAVTQYGAFRGLLKGTYRILRCNPCSKGGEDKP